jgi:formylglycine-generating enzyme required for sulfatase activity
MALKIAKRQAQNQYYDETLAEGDQPLRMMLIPTGTFLMGSPEEELERSDAEGPQHEVMVPQFFMAKYQVTQVQWRAVAELPLVKSRLDPEPSRFKGDRLPVEQISWHDAVEFCDRLTIHTNRQYRLPTEAEWEYACRAGTKTPFHFGETISTDYANYDGTDKTYGAYGPGTKGEFRQETTPVDRFGVANAYGLCDMHGNVWEWCQDPWHEGYAGAPRDGSEWIFKSGTGPGIIRGGTKASYQYDAKGDPNQRVVRGGSWNDYSWYCRSAYRYTFNPVNRYNDIGFRVVCSAPRALS